jgi:hypothetical protein
MLSAAMPTLADTTVLDAFRRWGYLEAQLDPLHEVTGRLTPQRHLDLAADGPEAEAARRIYPGFEDVDPRSVLFVSFSSKAQLRCPHRLKLYVPRVCPEK